MKRERFKLPCSVFVVFRQSNQILLLKRANTGWMDGFYSLPAGAIDGKEEAIVAACREAREEVCLDVVEQDLVLKHVIHCLTEGDEWMGLFYLTSQWEKTPVIGEPEKHSDLHWCDAGNLPENMVPYVKQALQSMERNIYYSSYGWI